ncbi:hypothetical protein G7070_13905 [Propioniciclava coleopterorum]|uniref:Smf/DprA SLOG domain-containing protein n=1 Tax=Propioniciclava coleopterorum TaxID=2714937 RepID=A0A6G7Y8K7_9ACTN|nr:hypothetical protein G7070_13905 [Propioniciclava coleopterorum]
MFVVPGDPEWPARLEGLATVSVQQWGGAPLGLWVRGRVPLAEAAGGSVAIVGARAASAYGERVATELAADLAAARLAVVSGPPTASTRARTGGRSPRVASGSRWSQAGSTRPTRGRTPGCWTSSRSRAPSCRRCRRGNTPRAAGSSFATG